jgi:purine-binding chemotaxis protein CheW
LSIPDLGSKIPPVFDVPGPYLVFELAGQRFALGIAAIVEVTPVVYGVPLPEPPPMVESAIDYHGQVIAILDVRRRFGLPAKPVELRDHLIVARAAGRMVALRVDRALELLEIPPEAIARGSQAMPGVGLVAGVARTEDGLLLIHDLATFLSEAEHRTVETALVELERSSA